MKKNLVLLLFISLSASVFAQSELKVIERVKDYKKSVKANPENKLSGIKSHLAGVALDLRYADTNNFVGRKMYRGEIRETYLRKPALLALQKVQEELVSQNLGLKIWDAYRPYSVTKDFWELIKDDRYVANPARGSYHNRGSAVDLTIIDLRTGKELNMGTGFDNFTDSAHHSFKNLPEEILKNRILLKSVMEKHGFKALETEWWHYTFQSDIKFDVMDIPFYKL
ncbi:MAG TPA: M15 family metallopeptidase [Niabella sp.]|jgi:D-alanyl-D-alanine dipeptidase|nr:M15 family metallopeptidase [Chitinophagaceae bacterium]HUN04811.1 M15 family metallopeptidase [Niabella sp.]